MGKMDQRSFIVLKTRRSYFAFLIRKKASIIAFLIAFSMNTYQPARFYLSIYYQFPFKFHLNHVWLKIVERKIIIQQTKSSKPLFFITARQEKRLHYQLSLVKINVLINGITDDNDENKWEMPRDWKIQ